MNLNYSLDKNPGVIEGETYNYKTSRESDKYRDFIDLQKTVNATLNKNGEKNLNQVEGNNLNSLKTGGSWNNVSQA